MESATVSGSRERMFHRPTNLPAVKAGRVGRRLCLRGGAVRGPGRVAGCDAELSVKAGRVGRRLCLRGDAVRGPGRVADCDAELSVKAGRVGRRLCLRGGAVRGPGRVADCDAELSVKAGRVGQRLPASESALCVGRAGSPAVTQSSSVEL